jgi:hypothetical protein
MGRMKDIAIDQMNEERIKITSHSCPICSKAPDSYVVHIAAYERWRKGDHIQFAFPKLNADQRERLITGICTECWDKCFK